MTKAPCILFPYNAVMCNVVFTLKIPVIAAHVKLNITTVPSHLGPLPTDPETILDNKSCRVLPPMGTRDCQSYFKVLLPMGTGDSDNYLFE